MTTKEWSHLPNAKHIDWVLDTLKKNPDVWNAATDAAWRAAWDVSRAAAWNDVWCAARAAANAATLDSALGAALDAKYAALDAVVDAALDAKYAAWTEWDAVAALIAWDDSSKLLDMSVEEVTRIAWDDSGKLLDKSVEEVKGLVKEGNHAAVLLLPAVIVKHKLKDLNND